MTGTGPRDRAAAAFDAAGAAVAGIPALAPLARALATHRERLADPPRVALVGRVSSGKSTLVNALLGEDLAPTGVTELTFNVTWLTSGPARTVTAHFRDGGPPRRYRPEDLAALAGAARTGDADQLALLRAVDHLVVTDPNPVLRSFDLIDTPGLDSVLSGESARTLRLLGRDGDAVHAASSAAANQADALLVVTPWHGLADSLRGLLTQVTGAGFATQGPIGTVGALTKIELLWPDAADPLRRAHELAERLMRAPGTARVLYTLAPVAGRLAAGAAALTAAQVADLSALAPLTARPAPGGSRPGGDPRAPGDALARHLCRGPLFESREYPDLPVPPARRAALVRLLSPYGVHLACRLLHERQATGLPALRAALVEQSGVTGLRRLLTEHFGNRADLIRTRGLLDRTYLVRDGLTPRLTGPRERLALTDAMAPLLALDHDEHGFAELRTLRDLYDGKLHLTPADTEELLCVTGEYGTTPAARLGLPETADHDALLARAHRHRARWAAHAVDPAYGGRTRQAAFTLRRSYERLIARLGRTGDAAGRARPTP
ncbi:dynamin family protein [Streptomyces sp. URMC 129]|uniref:dynamin family protein n=1 Tax=Streptomyces sp. URMC 129 TaxID=3423407 RepID=UPI003F1DD43A